MKVWIARDINEFSTTVILSTSEKPKLKCGDYYQVDRGLGELRLSSLKKLGVKLKPGECKQYDIPMFREVKPKARRRCTK